MFPAHHSLACILLPLPLTGGKPFGITFTSVIFLIFSIPLLFISGSLPGASSHSNQPSLLFPWEPLVCLIEAQFMQATQRNLTRLFFSASVGFSNVIVERINSVAHFFCRQGSNDEQRKGKDWKEWA